MALKRYLEGSYDTPYTNVKLPGCTQDFPSQKKKIVRSHHLWYKQCQCTVQYIYTTLFSTKGEGTALCTQMKNINEALKGDVGG